MGIVRGLYRNRPGTIRESSRDYTGIVQGLYGNRVGTIRESPEDYTGIAEGLYGNRQGTIREMETREGVVRDSNGGVAGGRCGVWGIYRPEGDGLMAYGLRSGESDGSCAHVLSGSNFLILSSLTLGIASLAFGAERDSSRGFVFAL